VSVLYAALKECSTTIRSESGTLTLTLNLSLNAKAVEHYSGALEAEISYHTRVEGLEEIIGPNRQVKEIRVKYETTGLTEDPQVFLAMHTTPKLTPTPISNPTSSNPNPD